MTAAFVYRFLSVKSCCNLVQNGQLFELPHKPYPKQFDFYLSRSQSCQIKLFYNNKYLDRRKWACHCYRVLYYYYCVFLDELKWCHCNIWLFFILFYFYLFVLFFICMPPHTLLLIVSNLSLCGAHVWLQPYSLLHLYSSLVDYMVIIMHLTNGIMIPHS